MKAKFIKGLNASKPITLKLLVSMGNSKEEGEYLEEFINLVNRHKTRIEKVEFILGCDLHRHYIGDEKATEQGTRWMNNAEQYLSKLQVKYEAPQRWRSITGTSGYAKMKQLVDEWYKSDVAFKKIVDGIAKQHSHKAGQEAAIAYLLEESAGIATLNGHATYPHQAFNGAIDYVLKKIGSKLEYCGYTFVEKSLHQDNRAANGAAKEKKEETLLREDNKKVSYILKPCLEVSDLMRTLGIFKRTDQVSLFEEALKLNEQYADLVNSKLPASSNTTVVTLKTRQQEIQQEEKANTPPILS